MIYLKLFWVYLKIGLFGFGGGYAMLPLIQHEVVEKNAWLTMEQFTNIVAISQMTPGPIGINSATYIGYTASGSILGSLTTTFALCLPSFILVSGVSSLLSKHNENPYVKSVFHLLRPTIIGLMAAASLLLMNKDNFPDIASIGICVATFILLHKTKLHPIWIISMAGIAGYFLYL